MTYPQIPQPQPAAVSGPGWPYPGYPPPATAPTGELLAEFSDRLLARIVDTGIFVVFGLILEVPIFIAMMLLLDSATLDDTPDPAAILLPFFGMIIVVIVLSVLATYVYEVEMILRSGQTVGKRIMKIRVVTLDGTPLTRGIAAKRWAAGSLAAAFIPAYRWIDGLWQLWDKPYRQCLHDKFALTAVVKLPAAAPGAAATGAA